MKKTLAAIGTMALLGAASPAMATPPPSGDKGDIFMDICIPVEKAPISPRGISPRGPSPRNILLQGVERRIHDDDIYVICIIDHSAD